MKHTPDRIYLGHTLVAAFSVTLAFLAYTAPTLLERRPLMRVLDGDAQDLQKMTCSQAGQTVTLQRTAQGGSLVELTAPDAKGVPQTQRFPGTQAAQDLFGQLMPLPALRALGMVDQDHLARFGLVPAQATLTLTTTHGQHTVLIGQSIYGSGDRYAYVAKQGAYSIRANLLAALLQGAQRLQDRRVFAVPREKVEKWVISRGQAQRTLVPHPRNDGGDQWIDADHPGNEPEWLTDFVERLFRLSAADQRPLPEGASVNFTVQCVLRDDVAVQAQFVTTPQGTWAHNPAAAAPYLLYADPGEALSNDVMTLLTEGAISHDG